MIVNGTSVGEVKHTWLLQETKLSKSEMHILTINSSFKRYDG